MTRKTRESLHARATVRQRARELRQRSTVAEEKLWEKLRDSRLAGLKFRRQHPVGRFIVDFYCASAKLVVELDGGIHDTQQEYDQARTGFLTQQRGLAVMRLRNEEVLQDRDGALDRIQQAATKLNSRPDYS